MWWSYRTKSGRLLTEAELERLTTEAERGYDIGTVSEPVGTDLIWLPLTPENMTTLAAGDVVRIDVKPGVVVMVRVNREPAHATTDFLSESTPGE